MCDSGARLARRRLEAAEERIVQQQADIPRELKVWCSHERPFTSWGATTRLVAAQGAARLQATNVLGGHAVDCA
jgi:hypothetical protein